MPQTKAPHKKSQPMGFSGRREATRAPTVENARITTPRQVVTRADEVGALSEASRKARTMAAKVVNQAVHASQEAAGRLILTAPYSALLRQRDATTRRRETVASSRSPLQPGRSSVPQGPFRRAASSRTLRGSSPHRTSCGRSGDL